MRFINELTIACLLFLVIGNIEARIGPKSTSNSKCDSKTRIKIDRSLSTVIPILNGVKVPEDEQSLRKYCNAIAYNVDNVSRYMKNCLGNFGPTIAKLTISPFNSEFNAICRTDKLTDKARDLLKMGHCANKASSQLKKCGQNMIEALMAITSAADNERIPMGCCHANLFEQCFYKATSNTDGCDRETIASTVKIGYDLIGNSIVNFCGEYFENPKKCKSLIAKTPKLKNKSKSKSVFLPLVALFESFQNVKCDKNTEQKMDQLFSNMITIGSDVPLPETEVQLKKYCSNITQNSGFVFGYVDSCVSDFGQFLAKIMISPLQKTFDGFCRPGKLSNKARQMLKAGVCGNKARDKLKVCMNRLIDSMVGTTLVPIKNRIPTSCCQAYALRECLIEATDSTKGCNKRTIDWVEKITMDTAGGAIGLVCGDYFGSNDACNQLIAETPKMDPKTYVRPKSAFLPVIALMESFPDLNGD